jgi:hypothetical protein
MEQQIVLGQKYYLKVTIFLKTLIILKTLVKKTIVKMNVHSKQIIQNGILVKLNKGQKHQIRKKLLIFFIKKS